MDRVFLLGILAALFTSGGFLPQVIKAQKLKHTKDLSLIMYVMFSFGLILWIFYGFFLKQTPIIVANAVTLFLCLYLIVLKIKYG